jgi:trans-2,3-dihydro-3-hydroxyanthranilate isomerase
VTAPGWPPAWAWIPGESTVIIEQGHALGRPGRIAVSLADQRVRVGGYGLVVADGTLTV